MKKITLYGHLAKRFGRHHHFDVRNPAEALRALCANFAGFREHVLEHGAAGYHVRVGKDYRNLDGLSYPVDGTISIIPAVGGAGGDGQVILGAALMIAAPYMAAYAASAMAGSIASTAATAAMTAAITSKIQSVGVALILGGVAQMLFAAPAAQTSEPAESTPGYAFNGPVNTVTQGNAVPVCYGKLMIGSQVVSAGMETLDIPV